MWNCEEFKALLQWAGFELIHLGLTRSNDAGPDEKTILAIAVLRIPRLAVRAQLASITTEKEPLHHSAAA